MARRQKVVMLLVLLFVSINAKGSDLTLRLYNNEKYEQIKILDFQKAHISSSCIKNGKPSCEAWNIFSGKPKPQSESKIPLAGDPAARYCWDIGAKNRILKSTDNKQYDYCVFSDGSMVDAWDLYYKHFPRK